MLSNRIKLRGVITSLRELKRNLERIERRGELTDYCRSEMRTVVILLEQEIAKIELVIDRMAQRE